MNPQTRVLLLISALSLTAIMCALGAPNETSSEPLTAHLSEISGTVQTLKPATGELTDASLGTEIVLGDQVITHFDSRARLDLSNQTIVRVGPLSSFTLQEITNTSGAFARIKLDIGTIWIILNGGTVEVETSAGLASVRGSYMYVSVDPNTLETYVTCLEGECSLGNAMGQMNMFAGQTAKMKDEFSPPTPGMMDDEDVEDWMENNPEATMVIVPLTATSSPGSTPVFVTATPSPQGGDLTATAKASLTSGAQSTPTSTATRVDCGPPQGWQTYTVVKGESLESLADAFQETESSLRHANCLGETTKLFEGMVLFVPNRATITPSPTLTPTTTPTPTSAPATKTPIPANATNTGVSVTNTPAATATNSLGNLTYLKGPVSSISACINTFEVSASDPDGVNSVKVYYSKSDPTLNTIDGFFTLDEQGGGIWKKDNFIPTNAPVGSDTVYWRFVLRDNQTYDTFGTIYSYLDSYDCGAPASFSKVTTPNGATITSGAECKNLFQADVTDPEGVDHVEVKYSLGNNLFSPAYYSIPFTNTSGITWEATIDLDIKGLTPPVTVYYRLAVQDYAGLVTYWPNTGEFSLSDQYGCDGSTSTSP